MPSYAPQTSIGGEGERGKKGGVTSSKREISGERGADKSLPTQKRRPTVNSRASQKMWGRRKILERGRPTKIVPHIIRVLEFQEVMKPSGGKRESIGRKTLTRSQTILLVSRGEGEGTY